MSTLAPLGEMYGARLATLVLHYRYIIAQLGLLRVASSRSFFFLLLLLLLLLVSIFIIITKKKRTREHTEKAICIYTCILRMCTDAFDILPVKREGTDAITSVSFPFFLVWGLMTFGVFHLRKASWFLTHMM